MTVLGLVDIHRGRVVVDLHGQRTRIMVAVTVGYGEADLHRDVFFRGAVGRMDQRLADLEGVRTVSGDVERKDDVVRVMSRRGQDRVAVARRGRIIERLLSGQAALQLVDGLDVRRRRKGDGLDVIGTRSKQRASSARSRVDARRNVAIAAKVHRREQRLRFVVQDLLGRDIVRIRDVVDNGHFQLAGHGDRIAVAIRRHQHRTEVDAGNAAVTRLQIGIGAVVSDVVKAIVELERIGPRRGIDLQREDGVTVGAGGQRVAVHQIGQRRSVRREVQIAQRRRIAAREREGVRPRPVGTKVHMTRERTEDVGRTRALVVGTVGPGAVGVAVVRAGAQRILRVDVILGDLLVDHLARDARAIIQELDLAGDIDVIAGGVAIGVRYRQLNGHAAGRERDRLVVAVVAIGGRRVVRLIERDILSDRNLAGGRIDRDCKSGRIASVDNRIAVIGRVITADDDTVLEEQVDLAARSRLEARNRRRSWPASVHTVSNGYHRRHLRRN